MMHSYSSRGFGEPNPALTEVKNGVVGAHEDVSEYPAISNDATRRNISSKHVLTVSLCLTF